MFNRFRRERPQPQPQAQKPPPEPQGPPPPVGRTLSRQIVVVLFLILAVWLLVNAALPQKSSGALTTPTLTPRPVPTLLTPTPRR